MSNSLFYDYTFFPRRNATRQGSHKLGEIVQIFPAHVVAPRKDSVVCVGDYTLGDGARRANESVLTKTMLTLDVDTEVESMDEFADAEDELFKAAERLRAAEIEHLIYSSYSHGRPKDGTLPYFGFRLVIPFLEPMTRANVANLAVDFKRMARAVVAKYKLPGNIMALSQPWYVPSVPDQAALDAAVYHYVPGRPFDWKSVEFDRAPPPLVIDVPDESNAPYRAVTAEEVLGRLHQRSLRFGDATLQTALRDVFSNEAPAPGKVRSRHEDLLIPLTMAIAKTSQPGEQADELLAALLPWLDVMQEIYPRSGSGWRGEAMRALEGALLKAPRWRAEQAARLDEFMKQYDARRTSGAEGIK